LAESGQSGGVQWSPVQSAGLQPDYVGERKVLDSSPGLPLTATKNYIIITVFNISVTVVYGVV